MARKQPRMGLFSRLRAPWYDAVMKVLMLTDVAKVGRRGSIVDVADGFALNSLIPGRKAIAATKEAVAKHRAAEERARGEKAAHDALVESALRGIADSVVDVSAKANEIGYLFGKLHAKDVAAHIERSTRVAVDPAWLSFGSGVVSEVGDHTITISYGSVKVSLTLRVVAA